MTVNNPPLYLQNDGPNAEQHRHSHQSKHGGRPGILRPDDLIVSEKSGTANMSVDIAGGSVYVKGGESLYQGYYLCYNRGTENVAIATADPTNPRKDLVVARVRDSSESGVNDEWDFFVVEGTPAGSPSPDVASIPPNSHVLALIDVTASASSILNANITDLRTLDTYGQNDNGTAVLPSGEIQCTSTDRPLQNLYNGMKIYETDTAHHMLYNGSSWVFLGQNADGIWATYAPTLYNLTGSVTNARFTRIGDFVQVHINITVTSVTGNLEIGLPYDINAQSGFTGMGQCIALDTSAGLWYKGEIEVLGPTSPRAGFHTVNEGGGTARWAAAAPFTWASGDSLAFSISYEAS